MSATESVFSSHVDADGHEPAETGTVLEGEPNGRIHWLREEDGFMSGLFRCDPAVFEYEFEADEAIHVLEGEVSIRIGDRSADLGPGGIASFRKGERSVWTVKSPFKEFFVLAG